MNSSFCGGTADIVYLITNMDLIERSNPPLRVTPRRWHGASPEVTLWQIQRILGL